MNRRFPGVGDVLEQCGVKERTLAAAERHALDQEGWCVFAGLADAAWLARLRTAFEQALQAPGNSRQSGTRHADGLAGRDAALDGVWTHPRVIAATHHVLKAPFCVLLLGACDPLPGYGQQGLHTDWRPRMPAEPFRVATALWLLDDFEADNGATRLVPGSHKLPCPLPLSMQAPGYHHRDERIVVAQAGPPVSVRGSRLRTDPRAASPPAGTPVPGSPASSGSVSPAFPEAASSGTRMRGPVLSRAAGEVNAARRSLPWTFSPSRIRSTRTSWPIWVPSPRWQGSGKAIRASTRLLQPTGPWKHASASAWSLNRWGRS